MVDGLWFVVDGLWLMVYGSWFTVEGLWLLVDGLRFVVYGLWYVVYGSGSRLQGLLWGTTRSSRSPAVPRLSVRASRRSRPRSAPCVGPGFKLMV
jgi:hypothetical protein